MALLCFLSTTEVDLVDFFPQVINLPLHIFAILSEGGIPGVDS
jgi:hypothetical protein